MKHLLLIITLFSFNSVASEVISCGDAMKVGKEANLALHNEAQKRAQKAIEEFVEKKVVKPYVDILGLVSKPEQMASLIETYWCETSKTPLHSAYYRFYSSNKHVFK